jgi:membrane protein DedA with SNARE-associated domain
MRLFCATTSPTLPMDLSAFVQHYGLFAVAGGAFLEGETIVLLAGAAAHLGLLDLRWVIVAAALGAFAGDTFFFFLGRRYGTRVTQRFAWLASTVPHIDRLLSRWRWGAVIALRFMYGLRTAGPMLIGAGTMPSLEFLAANALGATLWAGLIAGLGFAGGRAIEAWLGDFAHAEKIVLGAVLAAGVLAALIRGLRRRRRPGPPA